MLMLALKYLLPVVSGLVATYLSKHFGTEIGAAVGGAVATVGAAALHRTAPPGGCKPPQGGLDPMAPNK